MLYTCRVIVQNNHLTWCKAQWHSNLTPTTPTNPTEPIFFVSGDLHWLLWSSCALATASSNITPPLKQREPSDANSRHASCFTITSFSYLHNQPNFSTFLYISLYSLPKSSHGALIYLQAERSGESTARWSAVCGWVRSSEVGHKWMGSFPTQW